ncbi:hypothetical protein GGI12_000166 [Dipsacomyces acuminosporus]|nr:hypothetical protein GGI12_000166 [Dipsacomyces acuminosporus]
MATRTNNYSGGSSSSSSNRGSAQKYQFLPLTNTSSQWLFNKEDILNTPSLVGNDYMTPAGKCYTLAEERNWRLRGCNFIHNVVRKLDLSQAVAATACVFFHRFYMRQSLIEYHAYEVAGACVFLATKVEEEKRSLKSITQVCAMVGAKGNEKEAAKNRDNWLRHLKRLEVIVLENCCFDMEIVHPYQFISTLIAELNISVQVGKAALAHVNDCLRTVICLLYKPEIVAVAALYLASSVCEEPVSHGIVNAPSLHLQPDDALEVEECVMDMIEFYQREAESEKATFRQQQHQHQQKLESQHS